MSPRRNVHFFLTLVTRQMAVHGCIASFPDPHPAFSQSWEWGGWWTWTQVWCPHIPLSKWLTVSKWWTIPMLNRWFPTWEKQLSALIVRHLLACILHTATPKADLNFCLPEVKPCHQYTKPLESFRSTLNRSITSYTPPDEEYDVMPSEIIWFHALQLLLSAFCAVLESS